MSREDKERQKEKAERKRDAAERKLMSEESQLELIYPCDQFQPCDYQKYLAAARELYDEKTGNTSKHNGDPTVVSKSVAEPEQPEVKKRVS